MPREGGREGGREGENEGKIAGWEEEGDGSQKRSRKGEMLA